MFRKKFIVTILILIIVLGGLAAAAKITGVKDKIESMLPWENSSWYAVHLANGQVYFGHIKKITDSTISLKDTYYLELYQQAQNQPATSQDFMVQQNSQGVYQLVERGSDKNLKTDHTLFINRSTVLFWEKLEKDSEIVSLLSKAPQQ
jgi:hypothetical protein